jgi:hypothetical protein
MREAIEKAWSLSQEVIIFDGTIYITERWWDNRPGCKWEVSGEVGWFVSDEEIDAMDVLKVHHDDDGITTIYTTNTGY